MLVKKTFKEYLKGIILQPMELTLNQLFGENVIENSENLTIVKSDLIGLDSQPVNSPTELFAALLNTAYSHFYGSIADSNGELFDIENNKLEYNNSSLYDSLHIFLWRISYRNSPYKSVTHQFIFNQYFLLEE